MVGKSAQIVIKVEDDENCVMIGTAIKHARTVGLYAFTPAEARIVGRHILQAADVAEGKPMPRGEITFTLEPVADKETVTT